MALTAPLAVGAVALTTGLGVAAIVKAFGIGFLARPRSDAGRRRTGSPGQHARRDGDRGGRLRRAGGGAVGGRRPRCGGCSTVLPASRDLVGFTDFGAVMRLPGVSRVDRAGLIAAALAAAVLVAVGLARWRSRRRPGPVSLPLWACGADDLTARMQYTATSFAEPLQRVFDDVLRPDTDVEVTHLAESRYLAAGRHLSGRDRRRDRGPALRAGARGGGRGAPDWCGALTPAACTSTWPTARSAC